MKSQAIWLHVDPARVTYAHHQPAATDNSKIEMQKGHLDCHA